MLADRGKEHASSSGTPAYTCGQNEIKQVIADKAVEFGYGEDESKEMAKKVYFEWVGIRLVKPIKGRMVECCFD